MPWLKNAVTNDSLSNIHTISPVVFAPTLSPSLTLMPEVMPPLPRLEDIARHQVNAGGDDNKNVNGPNNRQSALDPLDAQNRTTHTALDHQLFQRHYQPQEKTPDQK